MMTTIRCNGRPLHVSLSNRASVQLSQQTKTLAVEMELLFSCLIRKRVLFGETDAVESMPGIAIGFQPVMTEKCDIHAVEDRPAVTPFPIVHAERFTPKWLKIDYRGGEWQGEFGYVEN